METWLIVLLVVVLLGGGAGVTLVGANSAPLASRIATKKGSMMKPSSKDEVAGKIQRVRRRRMWGTTGSRGASSGRSPRSGSVRAAIPRHYGDAAGGGGGGAAGGGGLGGFGIHTHW